MFRKWNEMGYDHLNLSTQNLYDRAAKAERGSKALREYMEEQREQSAGTKNNNEGQESQNRSEISESYEFSSVSETDNYADQNQPAATREPTSQLTEPSTVEENNARNSVLFNKAKEVYSVIYNDEMSVNERQWSTKPRKIPTTKDLKMLNEITEKLISIMQTNSDNQKLWQLNCITYSVAVAWREINSEISENPGVKTRNKGTSHLENKITQTRQLLSKTKAERKAQMKGAKMTKKRRKRRRKIQTECDALSVNGLTEFIDKLKHRLKNLARKNRQREARQKQRKWDNAFQRDQGSVFKHLSESLKRKKDKEKPRLSKNEKKFEQADKHGKDQRCFQNINEVDAYWRGLWETEANENLDADWIKEVEESMGAKVSEEEIARIVEVSTDEVRQAIGKKKNWSKAERDQIRNFRWKKLTVLHQHIAKSFENTINEDRDLELDWMVMGETDLIPKEGEWTAANQRPMTLLNTCYKWLTSVLKEKMESHLEKFDMLQCDQRADGKYMGRGR